MNFKRKIYWREKGSSYTRFCKKIIDLGYEICFETNCGLDSNFQNQDYINAGAILKENYRDVINNSDILIKVNLLIDDEIKNIKV